MDKVRSIILWMQNLADNLDIRNVIKFCEKYRNILLWRFPDRMPVRSACILDLVFLLRVGLSSLIYTSGGRKEKKKYQGLQVEFSGM